MEVQALLSRKRTAPSPDILSPSDSGKFKLWKTTVPFSSFVLFHLLISACSIAYAVRRTSRYTPLWIFRNYEPPGKVAHSS